MPRFMPKGLVMKVTGLVFMLTIVASLAVGVLSPSTSHSVLWIPVCWPDTVVYEDGFTIRVLRCL